MNFKFNKSGINSYINTLNKRVVIAEQRIAEKLLHNLYMFSPKKTGALAANYSISINSNIGPDFNPNKIIPDFSIPSFTIKDQLYIVNNCPYINFVNYGTIYQLPQNFIERSISTTKLQIPDLLNGIDRIN